MRFDSLNQWLEWQTQLHHKSVDLGLERVAGVWQRLNQQYFSASPPAFFTISVAGTNGKGSSVAMLESILLAAGYRLGCYTSPHLVRYNERIRVDGAPVADTDLCEAFEAIDQSRAGISLSYFEFSTLAALYLFARAGIEVAVLEVGLGGRLDAVNIIDADAALVCAIGLDHQEWLGDTRETIGLEKAGIFRPAQQAVFSGRDMPASIADYAAKLGTRLLVAGTDFSWQVAADSASTWTFTPVQGPPLALPLPQLRGEHQLDNAAGVVALLQSVKQRLPVALQALRQGLLECRLQGRFEVIQQRIPVIVDVAHNPQSMAALSANLQRFMRRGRLLAVIGMLRDKAVAESLAEIADQVDAWFVFSTPGERGLTAENLAATIRQLSAETPLEVFTTLAEACDCALQWANDDDAMLVSGSFVTAGEFLEQYVQPL